MNNDQTAAEIRRLFANGDPDDVWSRTSAIVRRISPAYDFAPVEAVYRDVVRLFRGEYPGYGPIRTLYHDLRHTLDVFVCAVRLMHGVHVSGTRLSDTEITWIMTVALMHDIGYAQLAGEESGTGAQHTRSHVGRGIEFMRDYLPGRGFAAEWLAPIECMMQSTNPAVALADIGFASDRLRLLGQIVGTADLVGQMADRNYLEKLLFLYSEFKEAGFGGYQSAHDLLCRTRDFYEGTRHKLDREFGGIYARLAAHFADKLGVGTNYYLESIEKNMAYLAKVVALDEEESLAMLKRGGIVEKSRALASSR